MTTHVVETRRNAAVILEHAIARLGYYGTDGWFNPNSDLDAVHIIRQAKWSLEAMDSPASSRFWNEQRRAYDQMFEQL